MSLRPNTTYYYRVKAINSNQESEYSDVVSVTTLADNTLLQNPLPPSNPIVRKVIVQSAFTHLYLELPATNEYIAEYKLLLSSNSDYSNPLYNNFTYSLNKNTNIGIDNGNRYIVLTLLNLNPNTVYYGKLKTSNQIGLSEDTSFTFTTKPLLANPTILGITNLTAITGRVNWTSISSATGYKIDVATDSNFTSLVVNNVTVTGQTYYDIPTLVENTTYYCRVRATTASIVSVNSDTISFTTLNGTNTHPGLIYNLDNPFIVGVTNITDNQLTFNWYPVTKATGYSLDISTSITFNTFVQSNIVTSDTFHIFTNLTAGTVYYIRVKATNPVDNSDYVNTVTTTCTINNTLNPVTVLTPSTVLSKAFVLSWVKRNYANRYLIQLSISNTFASILRTVFTGDIDTFLFDGLTSTTTYYARIFALSSIEISPVSNVIIVTTIAALPAITVNAPTEITNSSIRLNWSTNAAYSTYKLSIYKQVSGSTTNYLGDGFFYLRDVGNNATAVVDIFLEGATTYSYFLTGITSSGDTNTSILQQFSTKAIAPVIQLSSDGKYLQWVNDCNSIEVSTDKEFKFLVQGWHPRTVTGSQIDIMKLINNKTNYYFRAYNTVNGLKGRYSNIVSSYDTNPLLLSPLVTDTTVSLKWKKSNSTAYRIQVKVLDTGNYVPISGHTFPIQLGDIDSFFVENLTPDTQYSVQISSFQNGKYTDLSLPVYFKTHKYLNTSIVTNNNSLIPLSVATTVSTFDTILLTFNTNTYSLILIDVSRDSSFLVVEQYIENTTNTILIDNLEYDTQYYIRFYGVSSNAKSPVGTSNIITSVLSIYPAALSSTPSITSNTVLNINEVILAWSNIDTTNGYEVEISENNSFTLLDSTSSITFLDTTKCLISGLSGTKTYYARVYGYNANSVSAYSNVVTIDTTP